MLSKKLLWEMLVLSLWSGRLGTHLCILRGNMCSSLKHPDHQPQPSAKSSEEVMCRRFVYSRTLIWSLTVCLCIFFRWLLDEDSLMTVGLGIHL